ncbi:MAG: hypothetical protein AB7O62_14885 [Pirellulales bacterium]
MSEILPVTPAPETSPTLALPPLPIVPQFEFSPSVDEQARIDQLVSELIQEQPDLVVDERLRSVVWKSGKVGPALILDDYSAIRVPAGMAVEYLQDRGRLRTRDGDYFVTNHPPEPGFAEYCSEQLGLGSPTWLTAARTASSLAISCWADRAVRRRLVSAIRQGHLTCVHPHMGNRPVWELAVQLSQAAHRPLEVVGPPPAISDWANDKLEFARVVSRLLGPSFVPRTQQACNLPALATMARDLGSRVTTLAIKTPDSAGGAGNYVLESERIRGRSLAGIRQTLQQILGGQPWDDSDELLVGSWESDVLAAPSAQLWLPPLGIGPPLVEGIYMQSIERAEGVFAGTQPANLEPELTQDMARWSWLLGSLFQRLGYVGRCSFDMVLIGKSFENCRIKFIECNGRWGGTSLPMTLINRLFGDGRTQPFATREYHDDRLKNVSFQQLLDELSDVLYDARTGRGRLILFTPGRMRIKGTVSAITLGATQESANETAQQLLPARLKNLLEDGETSSS